MYAQALINTREMESAMTLLHRQTTDDLEELFDS